MKKIELTLRDGSRAIGDVFDEHDFDKLKKSSSNGKTSIKI